jgi:hypothetical protein
MDADASMKNLLDCDCIVCPLDDETPDETIARLWEAAAPRLPFSRKQLDSMQDSCLEYRLEQVVIILTPKEHAVPGITKPLLIFGLPQEWMDWRSYMDCPIMLVVLVLSPSSQEFTAIMKSLVHIYRYSSIDKITRARTQEDLVIALAEAQAQAQAAAKDWAGHRRKGGCAR